MWCGQTRVLPAGDQTDGGKVLGDTGSCDSGVHTTGALQWRTCNNAHAQICLYTFAALYETPWTVSPASRLWEHLHQHKGTEEKLAFSSRIAFVHVFVSTCVFLFQDLADIHRNLLGEVRTSILNYGSRNLYQVFLDYKERYQDRNRFI